MRSRVRRDAASAAVRVEPEWIAGRLTYPDHCGVPDLKWQPPVNRSRSTYTLIWGNSKVTVLAQY